MLNILSNEQLNTQAPSIFATSPYNEVSSRYMFVPTDKVVDFLRRKDWSPVSATESRTRIAGKEGFCRHLIRFQNERINQEMGSGAGEVPEIILLNSHDRTSSYQLMAGFFRSACANGIIMGSSDFGSINIRHLGSDEVLKQVGTAIAQIVEKMPQAIQKVEAWKKIELTNEHAEAFALSAKELTGKDYYRGESELLLTRRYADREDKSLWTVFNTVQENIIKGGVYQRDKNNRPRRTKSIKSIGENVKLNKALWVLAEKMEALLS